MGNTVIVMIRMLKARESIYNPPSLLFIFSTGCLFTLEMNAARLLLARAELSLLGVAEEEMSFLHTKGESQSTFIESVVLCVPTVPLQSCSL